MALPAGTNNFTTRTNDITYCYKYLVLVIIIFLFCFYFVGWCCCCLVPYQRNQTRKKRRKKSDSDGFCALYLCAINSIQDNTNVTRYWYQPITVTMWFAYEYLLSSLHHFWSIKYYLSSGFLLMHSRHVIVWLVSAREWFRRTWSSRIVSLSGNVWSLW